MKKNKIIQVCAIDSTMDKLLRELNIMTAQEGYEVIGVCSKGHAIERLRKEGFNLININIARSIKPLSNLKSIIKMYKLFIKEKPDVVHVHTPVAAVLGRIAAKAAGVPHIIYTAHGFYFHENMKPIVYKLTYIVEKFMGKYFTDYLLTQSQEDESTAIEGKFLKKENIRAIGNGVDVHEKFNPKFISKQQGDLLRKEFGIEQDDKVITFIGRLVREKGILDLLEAFNILNKNQVKLIIVGDIFQGDRDIGLGNLVEKYRNNKDIIFTGVRNDINNILYITDIFCLPSYREGMPRSIIEAMAMECAVIATNIRGSREEVLEGKTGFLVGLSNPLDIKEKIEILLEDQNKLNSMKELGRKRAEELYDEKKVVRQQIDIINKLLTENELEVYHGDISKGYK